MTCSQGPSQSCYRGVTDLVTEGDRRLLPQSASLPTSGLDSPRLPSVTAITSGNYGADDLPRSSVLERARALTPPCHLKPLRTASPPSSSQYKNVLEFTNHTVLPNGINRLAVQSLS